MRKELKEALSNPDFKAKSAIQEAAVRFDKKSDRDVTGDIEGKIGVLVEVKPKGGGGYDYFQVED